MKFVVTVLFCLLLWRELQVKWPDDVLHLVVCDVGQGDAILLSYGTAQILIDAGPNEKVVACLSDFLPFWDKKIDVLVLTHFDEDHIGGFKYLVQNYEIANVFLNLTEYKDSKTFLELQERLLAMQSFGSQIKQPFLGQQISFAKFTPSHQAKYNSQPSLELTFLTPFAIDEAQVGVLEENKLFSWQKTETSLSAAKWQEMAVVESNNNGSIALIAQFDQLKILLLGDLETPREIALLERGLITQVDLQKVGHHGSKTASSLEFLQVSRPEMGLISCGLNNKFNHPHPEVLTNFQAITAEIWRTDAQGSIEILSDGQKFWLKDKNHNLFWKNSSQN
jgi:competence protein ComEC